MPGLLLLVAGAGLAVAYYLLGRKGLGPDPLFFFTAGGLGLAALAGAWVGGARFALRRARVLYGASRQLAGGDLSARTGLEREPGELGELARVFDQMAGSLEQREKEREKAESTLVTRTLQQTVVSALGQFALVSDDLSALLYQASVMLAQTLEVEYCAVWELEPGGQTMVLRAGVGWREGAVGNVSIPFDPDTQHGFTLTAGEPVVVENAGSETRFGGSRFLQEHGVVGGMTVAIAGHGQAFGVLGAHTTNQRKFTEDEVHFVLAVATVLAMAAARKRSERELHKRAAFAQLNPNPVMELAADANVTYANPAAVKLATAVGRKTPEELLPPDIGATVLTCLRTRQSRVGVETQLGERTLSWSFHPVSPIQVVHAYVEDITERLSLEAQLRQAQKLESIGQLAAGVAHDFNNILTVILGHSGMLLAKTGSQAELAEQAQTICFAAERAASLTRQLLLFSRKTVMQPKLLDLREVVSQLSKMLRRVLGENVTVEIEAPADLPAVRADAGMVEQVIMNLAVNARDAMPGGGRLTIATELAEIDEGYAATHPEARPGEFVCLRVSDTGCGMDGKTMARIFEPFFTTKEVGKGTGLGLATVYGIAKQHQGWVQVVSEPGQGSCFSVYLPAAAASTEVESGQRDSSSALSGGTETILLVEDEETIRTMARAILEECGYTVLEAGSGREALGIWDTRRESIDLLLSDIIMPEGISGVDLAEQFITTKGDLKILLTSGYSVDEMDTGFLRRGHAVFLQKPYTYGGLAQAVRDCLDARGERP
jgi:signal transduction histidine kinase/ActR/RegA family two-component response regulator